MLIRYCLLTSHFNFTLLYSLSRPWPLVFIYPSLLGIYTISETVPALMSGCTPFKPSSGITGYLTSHSVLWFLYSSTNPLQVLPELRLYLRLSLTSFALDLLTVWYGNVKHLSSNPLQVLPVLQPHKSLASDFLHSCGIFLHISHRTLFRYYRLSLPHKSLAPDYLRAVESYFTCVLL